MSMSNFDTRSLKKIDVQCVQSKIDRLKLPVETLARLISTSGTSLRGVLDGRRPNNRLLLKAYDVLVCLEKLVDLTSPIPVDLKNADVLRNLLLWISEGQLRISVDLDTDAQAIVEGGMRGLVGFDKNYLDRQEKEAKEIQEVQTV